MSREILDLAMACLGPAVLVAGILRRRRILAWRRRVSHVTGLIVDWDHTGDNSAPIIEFTTLDGQTVRERYWRGGDTGYYPTGKSVPVWYEPDNPKRFRVQMRRSIGPGVPLMAASLPLLPISWAALSEWLSWHR